MWFAMTEKDRLSEIMHSRQKQKFQRACTFYRVGTSLDQLVSVIHLRAGGAEYVAAFSWKQKPVRLLVASSHITKPSSRQSPKKTVLVVVGIFISHYFQSSRQKKVFFQLIHYNPLACADVLLKKSIYGTVVEIQDFVRLQLFWKQKFPLPVTSNHLYNTQTRN